MLLLKLCFAVTETVVLILLHAVRYSKELLCNARVIESMLVFFGHTRGKL